MSNETESADGIDQFWDVRAKKAEAERDAAVATNRDNLAMHEVELESLSKRCQAAIDGADDYRQLLAKAEKERDALREVVEAARAMATGCPHGCADPGCPVLRRAAPLRSALARLDARDAAAQDKTPGWATTQERAEDALKRELQPTGGLSPEQRAEVVLPPCQRDGSGSDWWRARHVSCTGSHHLDSAHEVMCACPCHRVAVPLVGESVSRQPLNPTQRAEVEAIVREVVAGACNASGWSDLALALRRGSR